MGKIRLYRSLVGDGDRVVLVLLGWLSNLDTFPYRSLAIPSTMMSKFQFHFVQLSNFGKSSMSPRVFQPEDYVAEVEQYLNLVEAKKIAVIAHSAGARFAIEYAAGNPQRVASLALLAPAGLNRKKASERQQNNARYFFSRHTETGVLAGNILRTTFVNIYNKNLENEVRRLKQPCRVYYGKKDRTIGFGSVNRFHLLTPAIKVITYPNLGHMLIRSKTVMAEACQFIYENE